MEQLTDENKHRQALPHRGINHARLGTKPSAARAVPTSTVSEGMNTKVLNAINQEQNTHGGCSIVAISVAPGAYTCAFPKDDQLLQANYQILKISLAP